LSTIDPLTGLSSRTESECARLGDTCARGSTSAVRPKLRAKAARQGTTHITARNGVISSIPASPCTCALWARECENVVIGARSQVGLIRHADQEIRVRPGPDRSSPYWVTPTASDKKPRRQGCRCRSRLSTHRWQSGCSPAPCRWRSHTAIGTYCPRSIVARLAPELPGHADVGAGPLWRRDRLSSTRMGRGFLMSAVHGQDHQLRCAGSVAYLALWEMGITRKAWFITYL
jgi:hypothetical protein